MAEWAYVIYFYCFFFALSSSFFPAIFPFFCFFCFFFSISPCFFLSFLSCCSYFVYFSRFSFFSFNCHHSKLFSSFHTFSLPLSLPHYFDFSSFYLLMFCDLYSIQYEWFSQLINQFIYYNISMNSFLF